MVEYSSQGGKKDGLQALSTPAELAPEFPNGAPTYLYANYNSEAKLNYLAIPILAKFGWTFKHTPLRLYVDAGPFVSFLLPAKQVTSGTSPFTWMQAVRNRCQVAHNHFTRTPILKTNSILPISVLKATWALPIFSAIAISLSRGAVTTGC